MVAIEGETVAEKFSIFLECKIKDKLQKTVKPKDMVRTLSKSFIGVL